MAGMKILGWGSAHGDRCVSNEDMKQYVDTSDEWIRSKTGIGQRYFAENKSNLDMAAEAGAKAVAHLTPEEKAEIDGLIVVLLRRIWRHRPWRRKWRVGWVFPER